MEILIVLLVLSALGELAATVGRDTRPINIGERDRSLVDWCPQADR